MPTTIRVLLVQFYDPTIPDALGPGADGIAFYELLDPCAHEPPCEIVCDEHPRSHHRYMGQPFAKDGPKKRPGATTEEIAKDRANIWGWNGNREAPTLQPSFLCNYPSTRDCPPARVHLFLNAGQISLCGDSTVALA